MIPYRKTNLLPFDGTLFLIPLNVPGETWRYWKEGVHLLPHFTQNRIRLFGKEIPEPRLTALYGDPEAFYTYSGSRRIPHAMPLFMQEMLEAISRTCGKIPFNSILFNKYRNGQDYMGFHSDNELELGSRPNIATINWGALRPMAFKHRKTKQRILIDIPEKCVLLMSGETQQHWMHAIPKRSKIIEPRVSASFRQVVGK